MFGSLAGLLGVLAVFFHPRRQLLHVLGRQLQFAVLLRRLCRQLAIAVRQPADATQDPARRIAHLAHQPLQAILHMANAGLQLTHLAVQRPLRRQRPRKIAGGQHVEVCDCPLQRCDNPARDADPDPHGDQRQRRQRAKRKDLGLLQRRQLPHVDVIATPLVQRLVGKILLVEIRLKRLDRHGEKRIDAGAALQPLRLFLQAVIEQTIAVFQGARRFGRSRAQALEPGKGLL